ncbi:type II toxin-antitoxin system RelE/ParE family toxin [Halomonas sp. PAMB 3264]|uniref:type II toxin-antitoxin system RelE/ParE family toxin n=1 Tax=Halomonas sp. PAMB 3264 TaxID=3075222 RepID=UPI002897829F|nr:type II toxin-antitoxin system RelE/ParE family toxin [Halomonas sp. PAMB 3264]WNL41950.1 type II toxin-antitoxin system RelE/ParE family toxin [Halomonas sp. PAMB 3264]
MENEEQACRGVAFLGDSKERLREFPSDARRQAGYQIDRVQNGLMPDDFKPMKTVGPGAYEITMKAENGEFRVFYVAKRGDFVYILHCFKKTTKKTEKKDIALGKERYRQLP